MVTVAAKVAMALGLDALVLWLIRLLISLVVISLIVALIVVETVAGVLTGGQPHQGTATPGGAVAGTPIAVPPTGGGLPLAGDLGSRIVQLAQVWLGVPYVFGGCSRTGVDCSCLVQNVYRSAGIRLPRVAVDQFNATMPVADPQPGDLVFFANTYMPGVSHVGIYIGNGQQINAPTTGEVVTVAPVFTGYWGAHYAGAHRVRV
jgi:cell wall-associated NlpC family hydrolase